LEKEEYATNSYKEVETALDIWFRQNLPVTIKNVLNKFQGVPYGWREEDIFAEVIKLLKDENIKLQMSGEVLLATDRATLDTLLNRQNFDRIRVEIRKKLDINLINNVKSISKSIFNKSNLPEDEDSLKEEFKKTINKELFSLKEILGRYRSSRSYQYPCKNELETYIKLLSNISDIRDIEEFYNYVFEKREDINTLSNKMIRIKSFFENQVVLFDKLAEKIIVYAEENKKYNAFSDKLNNVANQIIEILEMEEPFDRIPELSILEQEYVKEIVDILEKEAEPRIKKLEQYKQEIHSELENKNLIEEFSNRFAKEFDDVKETLEKVNKMDTILSADAWIENLKDEWYKRINSTLEKKALEQQKAETVEVVVKKTRYIKVNDVVPKTKEIKSKEDIEILVDIIRNNLIKALDEGQDIKLI